MHLLLHINCLKRGLSHGDSSKYALSDDHPGNNSGGLLDDLGSVCGLIMARSTAH